MRPICKENEETLEISKEISSHISLHLNKLMDRKSVSITCRFPLFVSCLFLIKTVNNKKSRARYDIILYHTWPCPIIQTLTITIRFFLFQVLRNNLFSESTLKILPLPDSRISTHGYIQVQISTSRQFPTLSDNL